MTGLDRIREALTDCLNRAGIEAVPAWSGRDRTHPRKAVTAVSLRGCAVRPGGFRDYLGERYNKEADRWEEIYGCKAKLTFGLDIYAPGQDGGSQCQQEFDRLADLFHGGELPGLRLESLSREETVYDGELGLFRCPVQAVCHAFLYAVAEEDGVFTDFEVRGGRTNE